MPPTDPSGRVALARYKAGLLEVMRAEARGELAAEADYDAALEALDPLFLEVPSDLYAELDAWADEAQEAIDEGRDVY